jgi:hypothetical protein
MYGQQNEFRLPADQALQLLASSISGMKGVRVTSLGSSAFQVSKQYYPPWTIVVSVLCFPIGLLALLGRTEAAQATVSVSPLGAGRCAIQFSGSQNVAINIAMNRAVEHYRVPSGSPAVVSTPIAVPPPPPAGNVQAAGWYADPTEGVSQWRYWDGSSWTDNTSPR